MNHNRKQSIRQTFLHPDELYLVTNDDVRYVTDRYTAYRVDDLPDRPRQALTILDDGVWSLSASGAAKPAPGFNMENLPNVGALFPVDEGKPVEILGVTLADVGKDVQLLTVEGGGLVGIDARVDLSGWAAIEAHADRPAAKPIRLYGDRDKSVMSGMVMPIRLVAERLATIAHAFAGHHGWKVNESKVA